MDYEYLLIIASIISIFLFIGTAAAVPFLISTIPEDYFLKDKRRKKPDTFFSLVLYMIFIVLKNLAGLLLAITGIILLFMPGQGILTIFMGLILLDFPGKWKMERKIIKNNKISAAVNWVRMKTGKKKIIIPDQ